MARRRAALALAAGLSAALALASGCGSGSASSESDTGGSGTSSEAGGDLTDVKVGVIPIVDTAPLWLGKEKGFFSDEGLNLDITTTTGGAAAVPGVVGGSFDIAFGNTVSMMVAVDQGLSLKYLTNGVTTTGEDPDFSAVVVPKDSPIKTPKDLEGKTVSVNNLKNIGDTTIRKVVRDDGGDPSTINFVEVAFPDAPAALERGQVDAAWVLEPFLSQSLGQGARVVTYNYVDFDPNLDIAGYFTTTDKIENDPEMVSAFQTAMKKSLSYAQDHPDEARDIVGTYTKIDEQTRAKMTLPRWKPEFDRAAYEKLGEAAQGDGTISSAPDLDAILPSQ
jgi:NitT/TauT family transport system substrate-binding protein